MEAAPVSFGKDSTAMAGEGMPLDAAVLYGTGMEFDAVHRVRDTVVPVPEAHGARYAGPHPKRPFLHGMPERPVCRTDRPMTRGYGRCGGLCRWGTPIKASAMDRWFRVNGVERRYIGIAADEAHRAGKAGMPYPPIEWGMTEADCLRHCTERGDKAGSGRGGPLPRARPVLVLVLPQQEQEGAKGHTGQPPLGMGQARGTGGKDRGTDEERLAG